MFKKHLLLVMCLGTYVAAMADGGYNVSYTDQYSNENVATITWSESGTSTLQEAIKTVGEKTFTNGLKKVKIIGEVSDVAALSTINCPTIDLSEAVLPSVSTGTFTNENVKYVVLPNGMAKADVNTWAKSRFTNLESAASADFVTEKQQKWVYDNDVVYEGQPTNINGTTATGTISVDVPLTVKESSYKKGDAEYKGTVLVGPDNKAYGIEDEKKLVSLTEHTGYIYSQSGARSEYTGLRSVQEDGKIYGCINWKSEHTLKLNQTISYTYDNGKYAYTGRVYGNVYDAFKYLLEGGKEVQLTKLENTTYYTYENNTYIYDGPTADKGESKVGHVGGTKVTLTASTGYYVYGSVYTGPIATDQNVLYGTYKTMEEALALTPVPAGSYTIAENVDGLGYITHICGSETPGASLYTGNGYYYEQNGYKIIYSGRIFYAQNDTEKTHPLGFLSDYNQPQLTTGTIYTYPSAEGESVTYTGTVFGENIGYIGGEDKTLTEKTGSVNYYTEADKKIVYTGYYISDDNYGYVGNNISPTKLTVLSSPTEVNYYEENGKLVIYTGKVYGDNTAYIDGQEVTLTYETYYKNGESIFNGLRTADNKKGYNDNDAFPLTASFEYAYTDPTTGEEKTFTSDQVLTTKTVEKTVELTQKEVDIPTDKIILTAYVKTPGTLVYTIMQMSVFHKYDKYDGGGWQSWADSQHGWYITGNEGGYLYKTENVRDLILSGNLNAVDMNTGGTCVDNDKHYSASGPNNWNALLNCKPEKIDLSDALFGEGENYHPEDMTISGYYAGSIKEIILPTAESQNTIPADFMYLCNGVKSLCIPYNYEIICERAFFNAHGLTHIYTTDPSNTENPDNVKTDHGDGSFTFSANLKEIRSEGKVDKGTFFGNGMQEKVFNIYNLAVKAPKCGAYAFQGDLTYGNNGFKGNWTHPICRENYTNGSHVICMLHYPTESKSYIREGGDCVEAANYEDITRVYTLADETGAVDGSGNTRAWPRHAEFYRSFNQAVSGHTWEGWKLYEDENAVYKEVVSVYSEGVVVDATKTYNREDYQGWHEFVLTENNIFVPFDPQNRYENFVENDWYTICVPYDIKKSELLMALGVKADGNNMVRRLKKNADGTTGLEETVSVTEDLYPDVRTLVQVKRSVNERKVTLCLSEPLVTATKCQDVYIPEDTRQGYEYTELTDADPVVMKGGYPYLVRPFLPDDERIKNIGAYVVSVASQNDFTRSTYKGGLGDTEKSAAGTTFSLPVKEGVETQALNKDKSLAQGSPVYVTLDGSAPCMYNFVGTYLNGNVPQYGYYLGKNKNTGKHQFFRTTKTTTKWNQYSAIIKGFTKPEFYIPSGADSKTIENVRRTFDPNQADDLIILSSESPTLAGKAMTLILDDSGEDDNTTTAIRDIDMDRNMDNNNKVYTIGGMLTNGSNRLQKGIYIKNGKKHVVK